MVWIGIDVSKRTLDVHIEGGERFRCKQPEEIPALVQRLSELESPHVVMEATGNYEWPLWEALDEQGIRCSVVNPAHAHAFRKSLGRLAKTDAVDAELLATMGAALRPKPTLLPSQDRRQLQVMVRRRAQIVRLQVAERNHGEHADEAMRKSIERVSQALEYELKELEQAIAAKLRQVPELKALNEVLQTVPGVGPTVAAGVLVHLPELGQVGKGEIAALAGLAPYNRDSGTLRGKRAIRAGRTPVRSLLYMSALVAVRHNPRLRTMYTRLLEGGKPKKLALIAVARKLVTVLNAMARHGTPWSEMPMDAT